MPEMTSPGDPFHWTVALRRVLRNLAEAYGSCKTSNSNAPPTIEPPLQCSVRPVAYGYVRAGLGAQWFVQPRYR